MAKAKNTALAKWDERLAQLAKTAKAAVAKIGSGGNFISLRGGIMTYQRGAIPENKIRCIVIDSVGENQLYTGKFEEGTFAVPDCYAFGNDPNSMAPNPEDVEKPVSETCAECPMNEWGSADVGKGKACKQVQRLALIAEADFESIEKAEIAYLKVPVTSTKAWAGYVRQLDDLYHRPPLAFITEIAIEKTAKLPGWGVIFKQVEPLEDDAFEALLSRYDEVSKTIAFPYPKVGELEQAAPARAKANGGVRKVGTPKSKQVAVAPVTMAAAGTTKVGLRRAVKPAKF